MRFRSLALVVSEARQTFLRFPLVLLSSFAAGTTALLMIEDVGSESVVGRLTQLCSLGIPLFFSLRMFDERRRATWPHGATQVVLPILGALALLALYVAADDWLDAVTYRRLAQLVIAVHLLVAFAPWLGQGTLNGFWQYNRALFLRFVTSLLFTGVLYLGLFIALLALDKLFGLDVDEKHYAWLWLIVAYVFNTWYFLGGVPRQLDTLDTETQYPTGLRILSQYILLPIVVVYLTILTTYIGKILLTRSWPSGWIGYLVSSVSVLGILSLLLVHPIRERAEQAWIRTYSRGFYAALLPSIAMLWVAIWKRIDQYGFTENRYFLTVIAVWLAGIALFFLVRQSRNIRVIPVTLCLLALGTFSGPWGAYSVSRRSQTARLEEIFVRNEMLVDGRLQPSDDSVSQEDRRQMSSVLTYLLETHGPQQLVEWFGGKAAYAEVDTLAANLVGGRPTWQRAQLIMHALDMEYVPEWQNPEHQRSFSFSQNAQQAVRISGYDLALQQISGHGGTAFAGRIRVDDDALDIRVDPQSYRVRITRVPGGVGNGEPWIEFSIEELADEITRRAGSGPVSPELVHAPLRIAWSDETTRVLVDVRSVSGHFVDDAPQIDRMQVDVYITDPVTP